MAQQKSAKKAIRQTKTRTIVNRKRKGILKSHIKRVSLSIAEKDAEKATYAFNEAVSVIDKMAASGLIHKNNAARKKSRLAKRISLLT
ncbi:MAG: 30S ribosomal protein S20 [bacterium]